MAKRSRRSFASARELDGNPRKSNGVGWNNSIVQSGNYAQDLKNKRVKTATTSLFYYAAGEPRKITNNRTGNRISIKTLQGKTAGLGKS